MDNIADRTGKAYGFLWKQGMGSNFPKRWHFNNMQEAIPEPIIRGSFGIEVGSGCGLDTAIMAKSNAAVKIFSLDISDGIFEAKKIASGLSNICLVKGSALEIPAQDNVFDFAYSFGVLHHIHNPLSGLKEILRVLKPGSPAFIYLYEDHSESPIKSLSVKFTNSLRKITTRLPLHFLHFLCHCASPFAVLLFSYPARLMHACKFTRPLSERMPFNFGSHLFSVAGDLYDRFGAPIELRFSRAAAIKLFDESGFSNIMITRMRATSGWVVWGFKDICSRTKT